MKKVIGGKMYNSDTATKIASDRDGNGGDFRHYDETLYKTAKGSFFLEGKGGPMSRWARAAFGGGMSGGGGIQALTVEEAREWCEQHDVDADTIAEHFTVEEA